MKTIFAVMFFLVSTIALSIAQPGPLAAPQPSYTALAVPAPVVDQPTVDALPDCFHLPSGIVGFANGEMHGSGKIAALWGALMLLLRVLAELLGRAAMAGSVNATTAMRVVSYVLALLGWVSGKAGWGTPRATIVQTMPSTDMLKK